MSFERAIDYIQERTPSGSQGAKGELMMTVFALKELLQSSMALRSGKGSLLQKGSKSRAAGNVLGQENLTVSRTTTPNRLAAQMAGFTPCKQLHIPSQKRESC